MKKNEVRIGGTYMAKVSEKVVAVRLDAENQHGGWDATNLSTGKKVRIKSAQRLRGPARSHAEPVHQVAPQPEPDRVPITQLDREAKTDSAKKVSGLDAAYQELKSVGAPMRCGAIVKMIIEKGMWQTDGKTPAATIYSAILREIQAKGAESRFVKTERGLFTINPGK